MEQTMNRNMNDGMMMESANTGSAKQGKGMMFGMIACAVLAVAGIGFGVYEMTQVKSAKQQIADLKIEVKNTDGSTTTVETDKIENKEDDKTVTITDTKAAINTKEYIYVGEWGIKIHLDDTVKNVNYTYRKWDDDNGTLYVSARVINDPTLNAQYPDDFTDLNHGTGIVGISFHRSVDGCAGAANPEPRCPKTVKNSDGMEIGINASSEQAYRSESEEQHQWEERAVGALMSIISNDANYSAI